MRRRVVKVTLLVVAMLGVVCFILARADFSGPTKLPAMRKALGLEVKLLECKRLANGQVQVKMTVAGPNGDGPDVHTCVEEPSARCASLLGEDNDTDSITLEHGPMRMTSHFSFSQRADSIDVSLPIHIDRLDKHVSFKFANVTPANLPQTRKVEGYKMTLLSATDNCMPQEPKWMAYVTYGSISPNKLSPCFDLQVATTLSDDQCTPDGPSLQSAGAQITPDVIYGQFDTPSSASGDPTLMERAVALFSAEKADQMMQSRLTEAAGSTHRNGNYIYGFPMARRPKGSFTFEVKFVLPPDKKDAAVVEFKNVPVR